MLPIVTTDVTVRLNVFADVAPAASVTVTVNVVVASVVVGVPLTRPVLVLKLMLLGSVPPVSVKAYGSVPPLAVTGVKASVMLTVPVVLGTACVVFKGDPAAVTFTNRVTCALEVYVARAAVNVMLYVPAPVPADTVVV
jgi:hypothetical protein